RNPEVVPVELIQAKSQSSAFHQAAHHFLRREIFSGDFARCAAMAFVISFNAVHSRQDVVHRFETKQAFARWEEFAEACLLGNYGPACGEVTGAAITKPARFGTNVLVARDCKLSARLPDIITIPGGILRNIYR